MAKKLSIDRSRAESPRLEHRRATSIRETLLERFFLQRHSSEDPGPEALHRRVIIQPGARVQPWP